MKALSLLLATGVAALFLVRTATCQDGVAAVLARAEQLVARGQWTDGRQLLEREVRGCPAAEGTACRAALFRALGYLCQRQAGSDPARATELLASAADFYNRALRESPADGATLRNLALVYRSLGRDTDLQRTLSRGLRTDSAHAAFYNLLWGDVLADGGAPGRAIEAYRRAIAAAPDDEAARRHLVEAYRDLPADSALNLYRLVAASPDWEAQFPDASARAYEVVLAKLSRANEDAAQRACIRWVVVLSDAQLLSVERLDAVRESWLVPAIASFKVFLTDAKRPPRDPIWQVREGRDAVGHAALALGRERLTTADTLGAELYWQVGMAMTEGPPQTPVFLDLAMETAALYQRYRLDSGGVKFARLEGALFDAKGRAYDVADKDAIQQLHTVLGVIYARRGIWDSHTPWHNAFFQLAHALSTAHERDSLNGSYQPLPQLRELLADGYREKGRAQEAAATYLSAAQAYLDADDVGAASRILESRVSPGPESSSRFSALRQFVSARAARGPGGGERPTIDACDRTAQDAVRMGQSARLDDGFLKRQRFKLVADCVLTGPEPVRPADAARVFRMVTDDKVPLVGAGDLVRLQRSEAAVNQLLHLPTESRPNRYTPSPSRAATIVPVQLSSDARPRYIPVSADALLGVKVVEQLGAEPAVRGVQVRKGQVTFVTTAVTDAEQARLRQKVQQTVNGVQSTNFRQTWMMLPPPQPPPPAPPPPPPPPPPVDSAAIVKNALDSIVDAYARALQSQRVAVVQQVVRDVNAHALDSLFQRADKLQARLDVADVRVDRDRAMAVITGIVQYVERGVVRREPVKQRAMFARGPDGRWRMMSIR